MDDRVKFLEAQLAAASDLPNKIDLLNECAWEVRDTDPARAASLSETAYRLFNSAAAGDQAYQPGIVMWLRGLAHASLRAGDFSQSLAQSMQALAQLGSVSMPTVEADLLRNVAIIQGSLGNYAEGLDYGFKALALVQSIGDREREAGVLNSIGVIYLHAKNLDESLRMLQQALTLNRELCQMRVEATTLNNQSQVLRALGNCDGALDAGLQALRRAEETQFPSAVITATGTVGEAYLAQTDYDSARQYLQRYLASARSAGSKRDEVWALILLGECDHHQQQDTPALANLYQALDIAQPVGLRSEQARCHELLADLYERQGDLRQAVAQLRLLVQTRETIFNNATASRIANLHVLHQVEMAKRDAEIHYLKTIELQREIEDRKRTEAALEELAAVDPLTGVFNRRQFFAMAEPQVQAALQKHQPLALILFDIDHFKAINDNHGHAAGDQVLAAVARVISGHLRTGELVGRVGGDEFAITLPASNQLQGQQVGQRLQEAVAAQPFQADDDSLSLTISLGVAELDQTRNDDLGALLGQADQAMYSAKWAGRNRIALFPIK